MLPFRWLEDQAEITLVTITTPETALLSLSPNSLFSFEIWRPHWQQTGFCIQLYWKRITFVFQMVQDCFEETTLAINTTQEIALLPLSPNSLSSLEVWRTHWLQTGFCTQLYWKADSGIASEKLTSGVEGDIAIQPNNSYRIFDQETSKKRAQLFKKGRPPAISLPSRSRAFWMNPLSPLLPSHNPWIYWPEIDLSHDHWLTKARLFVPSCIEKQTLASHLSHLGWQLGREADPAYNPTLPLVQHLLFRSFKMRSLPSFPFPSLPQDSLTNDRLSVPSCIEKQISGVASLGA